MNAKIGTWRFPSGNEIEVFLEPQERKGVRMVDCRWLEFPPSPEDLRHYQETIGPQITARISEYLEVPPSRALHVTLE